MTEQNNETRHAPRGLGTLESQLMDVLWGTSEQLTVQGVVDGMGDDHNYKTVMTVLNRLVEKGLLARELDGRAYRYRPAQTRDEFLRALADEMVREFREAYGPGSESHLAEAVGVAAPQPAAAASAAPRALPYVDDEPEPRSNFWRFVGIIAAIEIVAMLLRRRGDD